MDHMVLRERHRKRKQKRLGIMPSHTPDANLLWRHEMKKLRVQVLLTCLFSNLPTYTALPASPPSSSSANDPFVLRANEAARRSQRRRSVLRAVAWVVGLVLLAGALYQSIGHVRDDYLYPPLGIRVNVGRHDAWPHFMHIHCVGSGSPTVLFEAGLPFSSLSFELVMQEVARRDGLAANMTFCSYDRSGYGWSEAGVYPRNISVIVDELHRLLQVAAVPTPYVLAGWSYGGPISQLYAARYPHAVAGLVLIETVIANQTTRIEGFAEHLVEGIRTFDIARFVQWVGVYRLAGALGLLPEASGAPPAFLPTSLYNAVLASVTKYKFPETAYQELLAFEESELIFNEALRPPATKPLQGLPVVNVVAVTEAMSEAERQLWIATQKGEASALTDNYRQAVVYSDHFVPWSKPSSVIDAVRLCIEMSGIQHQPHSHHHLH